MLLNKYIIGIATSIIGFLNVAYAQEVMEGTEFYHPDESSVEIIIPVLPDLPIGSMPEQTVYARHRLGWMKLYRESKMDWRGPTLYCRDLNAVATLIVGGPRDVIEKAVNEIPKCGGVALASSAIATLIASPATAKPVFYAAFKACMATHIADQVDSLSFEMPISTETGAWGKC